MCRILRISLLLVVTVLLACQRDEATAPQSLIPDVGAAQAGTSKIAFVSQRDGNPEIYVMNGDGSGQTRLSNAGRTFRAHQPSWSPDGSWIAFVGDWVHCECLHKVAPDGSAASQVTDHTSSWGDFEPAWSPDGQTIAFVRALIDNYEIFRIGADGSGETRLTNSGPFKVNNNSPRWSPDGRQIAFWSFLPCPQACTNGPNEIFVVNADGSGKTQLTHTGRDTEVSWSPDGRQLVFTTGRDGNAEIYVMNADGSGQTRLTNNPAAEGSPRWSPAGNRIAFTSNRDGNVEIYVMNADGSSQTRLTNATGDDSQASWSPDGSQIAFTSHRDGNAEIYLIGADGSAPTRLTNDPGADSGPSWSPVGYHQSSAPAHVAFATQPPAAVNANAVISPAIRVSVTDASWHAVPGGVVRLEIGTSPTPGATLSGTTEARVVNGVATFDDLRIDQPGAGYTLRATAGAVSSVSAAFTVVGSAARD